MKVLKVIAIAAALSAVTGAAMADSSVVHEKWAFDGKQLIPSGVRAEVGTTGYGGALLWDVNPYVGLALGYNGGDISWSDDLKINGSTYDLDMDNKTAYLNVEMRPWGTNDNMFVKSLYVAAGVAYIDNDYDLNRRVDGTRAFRVNNQDFLADANGVSIKGNMNYDNTFAPYVGFGIAPQFNKNFGAFAEIGAYYTGNPSVNLNATGNASTEGSQSLDEAVKGEAYKIANDDKYEWLPVGKVGVSYRW